MNYRHPGTGPVISLLLHYDLQLPPEADPVQRWRIDWGDGIVQVTAGGAGGSILATHRYTAAGEKTITVSGKSEDAAFTVQTTTTVRDVAPVASVSRLDGGNVGVLRQSPFTLLLNGSDAGDPIDHWSIDWGDGQSDAAIPGDAWYATHLYNKGDQTYQITATAFAAGAQSEPAQMEIWTSAPPMLATPTHVVAMEASATQIDVGWVDRTDDEEGYLIRYVPDIWPVDWAQAAEVTAPANAKGYSITGLMPDTPYLFQVLAYNDTTGAVSYYQPYQVRAVTYATDIAAPSGLSVDLNEDETSSVAHLTDNSTNEAGFVLDEYNPAFEAYGETGWGTGGAGTLPSSTGTGPVEGGGGASSWHNSLVRARARGAQPRGRESFLIALPRPIL